MKKNRKLLKVCLMMALAIALLSSTGKAEVFAAAREDAYYYDYYQIVNMNGQPVHEIILHEGETLMLMLGEAEEDGTYTMDNSSYRGSTDWALVADLDPDYTTCDSVECFFENEYVKIWRTTLSNQACFAVKGLRATNSSHDFWVVLADLGRDYPSTMARIPVSVVAAEPGVSYPVYREMPEGCYATVEEVYEYMRCQRRNRIASYGIAMPYEVRDEFDEFEGAYGFYTHQGELDPDEGDYMYHSGVGFRSAYPGDRVITYHGEEYATYEIDDYADFFTTYEQERAVDAKIAQLFGPGGALECTKQMGVYHQVAALMNYLNTTVSYIGTTEKVCHSAYGALINGQATCEGYALAFYRLLRELGIPNRIIMIDAVGAHTSNLVYINGKYYYCDVGANILLRGSSTYNPGTLQYYYLTPEFQENILNKISYEDCDPNVVMQPLFVTPNSVVLNQQWAAFDSIGHQFQLVATVSPADADNKNVIWSSSDPSVATVDQNGVVTIVGAGMAGIVAKAEAANCADVCVIDVILPGGNSDTPAYPAEQVQQVRSFVERMYTVVLERAADENGLRDWTAGLIEWRVDGAQVVDGFVNSAEFVNRGLSNEEYIKTLYRAILNREADEAGLADWLRAFELGYSRQDLLNGFVVSAEFDSLCNSYGICAVIDQEDLVRKFASRMYTVALNRPADEAGLRDWVNGLVSGEIDGAAIGNGFINSAEFVARGLSDSKYIDVLYQTFLGRKVDGSGMRSWVLAFALGSNRQDMLNGVVGSAEFDALCDEYGIISVFTREDRVKSFVKRMYTVALNREADENGMQSWVQGLLNGVVNGAQVADGFINSAEFAARGLSDEEYINTLYMTFFNRPADAAGMADWLRAIALGNSRRDIMIGFINSNEFGALCESYGIIRGSLN